MAEALSTAQIPGWLKWVTDFDATYKMYVANYDALYALRPYVVANQPALLPEHDRLLSRFRDAYPKISELRRMRETVGSWLQAAGATIQSALNFTGVQAGVDWLKERFGLSGLNAVPVIFVVVGLASATAALVSIAALVKDAYVYSQRLNALREAQAKGATPEQAAAIVNSVLGKPGTNIGGSFLGLPVNALIMSALAIFLGPPLIAALSKGRK